MNHWNVPPVVLDYAKNRRNNYLSLVRLKDIDIPLKTKED